MGDEKKSIILGCGDIIVDNQSKESGILVRKFDLIENIDSNLSGVFAWEILWSGGGSPSTQKRLQPNIELNIGDIIVDHFGGYIGILINRTHHIDIVEDDVYIWEVKWLNNRKENKDRNIILNCILEEKGLKFSILAGSYDWYSINETE